MAHTNRSERHRKTAVELKLKTLAKRETKLPSNVVVVAVLLNSVPLTPTVDWKIHEGTVRVSKRFLSEIRRGHVELQYHKQSTLSSGWLFTEVSVPAEQATLAEQTAQTTPTTPTTPTTASQAASGE